MTQNCCICCTRSNDVMNDTSVLRVFSVLPSLPTRGHVLAASAIHQVGFCAKPSESLEKKRYCGRGSLNLCQARPIWGMVGSVPCVRKVAGSNSALATT